MTRNDLLVLAACCAAFPVAGVLSIVVLAWWFTR